MKEHPAKQFIAASALFVAAILVVSYGTVTSYYAGYLGYFGINIKYIDFWPHLPDFLLLAAPIIVALAIIAGLSALIMFFLNILGRHLSKKTRKEFVREIGEALILPQSMGILAILITLVIASFGLTYVTQEKKGTEDAKNQTQFIRLGPDSQKIEVLIYQNGGTGFTKIYDKKSKTFDPSYKTVEFKNQTLEQVTLNKN